MKVATQLYFALLTGLMALCGPRAEAQCNFTLKLKDASGDGWTGGKVTIRTGADSTTYSLFDGADSTVVVSVKTSDTLVIRWTSGLYPGETSFQLLDNDQQVVYKSVPLTIAPKILFRGKAKCADCLRPVGVRIENVWDTRLRLRWNPGGTAPIAGWRVITGPQGFVPGPGVGDTLQVATPKATVTGLKEKTKYDCYVEQLCPGNLASGRIGPLSFETYWSDDVAITGVVSPRSDCSLGLDTVKILMTNFGANPQSLIPFKYSVNGIDAGVPQPKDGFYTGVLGKDSTSAIAFETTYDFSDPGEFVITIYTQMMNDDNPTNDTFTYYLTNSIVPNYRQTFERWDGAWTADNKDSKNNVWEYGVPDKPEIPNAAEGKNAWVTDLKDLTPIIERSVLLSPCFNFAGQTTDPMMAFSLIYDNGLNSDGGYLEMSTDNGATWAKVDTTTNGGLNWYNTDNVLNGPVWSGKSNGWITAKDTLKGAAGKSEVRLRFVHFTDGFLAGSGGMGVDNIQVFIPAPRDLVALKTTTTGEKNPCGLSRDSIQFTYTNFGTQPQRLYELAYSINGGPTVVEAINGDTIFPDEVVTYTFKKPFDSRNGTFQIRAWVAVAGEANSLNDTVAYAVKHLVYPVPVVEDFENGKPEGWTLDPEAEITNGHNNQTFAVAVNLFSFNNKFTHTMPVVGPVKAGDSLYFDYRITDFELDSLSNGTEPTILAPGTRIDVQLSNDCGQNFQNLYIIRNFTHVPSATLRTLALSLKNYIGENIIVRFAGLHTAGDFWFDLDNVNIVPGTIVSVQQPTAIITEMKLQPNPTTGQVQLKAKLEQVAEAHVAITDILGRSVWSAAFSKADEINAMIDLSNQPEGIYLVRLLAGGEVMTKKLVKNGKD